MPQISQLADVFNSQLFWLTAVFLVIFLGIGYGIGILSFLFIVFVVALELLMCVIQAYVFALLTTLYLSDAIHLH